MSREQDSVVRWWTLFVVGHLVEAQAVASRWLSCEPDVERAVRDGFEAFLKDAGARPVVAWRADVARSVNAAAVGVLCERYKGFFFSRVRRVLTDPQDIEDAVATVHLRLLAMSGGLRHPQAPSNFLGTVAHNVATDLVRKSRWCVPFDDRWHGQVADDRFLEDWLAAARDEKLHLLGEALRTLTVQEQCLIHLIYVEGRSRERAGRDLGLSRDQVRLRESRVLAKLRQAIEASAA